MVLTFQSNAQTIHHRLTVSLDISGHTLDVTDSITIPGKLVGQPEKMVLSLNRNLIPQVSDPLVMLKKFPGMEEGPVFSNYMVDVKRDNAEDLLLVVKYSGIINQTISSGADEYARGFSETSGIISDSGVYLAASTYWIPTFGDALVTFDMAVTLPVDWNVVSQGERVVNQAEGNVRKVVYHEPHPSEEVYLVAAEWTEYEKLAGDVKVQAFLRTPDSALAMRYIDATAGYLEMYVDLVGPYPYTKFALVENFWETGFGMPSFTLLGQKIIRFPWILYTSYPHELLHNWWGNSVYVDFDLGNWCEGLTAYMADHLLKEQSGQGAEYRRETLQKFTDYVNDENDFPVIDFRSRNNPAEEAIGYGKCLMFNHMLRKEVGDETYVDAYRRFYRDNMYKVSTFDDILASFSEEQETDLAPFFTRWLTRTGAPDLKLDNVAVQTAGDGYHLRFDLLQVQQEAPFSVSVPVAVFFQDSVELTSVVSDKHTVNCEFNFKDRPVRIEVDPRFDVFRRLDKAEVPPTLSQVFGSSDGMIILPEESPFKAAYETLAETWKMTQETQGKNLKVVTDAELDGVPVNVSAWVIGFENKFAPLFDVGGGYRQAFNEAQLELLQTLSAEGSLVFTIPNPGNSEFTLGFVGTNVEAAIPGLARLLTHYGKYSYLGFEGERPNNVLKGNFPAIHSPLVFPIPYDGQYVQSEAVLKPSAPLID